MKAGTLEGMIRRTSNFFGIDIHRFRPEVTDIGRLVAMLEKHHVDLVLDVGANVGQFARSLRRAGYWERIISFEPLSSVYAQLQKASKNDPLWDIAPRVAIGDHESEVDMLIARNSVSSSALTMLESHAQAAPDSAHIGSERVPLTRLDTVIGRYLETDSVPFLKIDTQGYEDRVLDGAPELIGRLSGLQLELSFVPLYEGQQLFEILLERIKALGFSVWAIWPGFCDSRSGRMLQVDTVFFRD